MPIIRTLEDNENSLNEVINVYATGTVYALMLHNKSEEITKDSAVMRRVTVC